LIKFTRSHVYILSICRGSHSILQNLFNKQLLCEFRSRSQKKSKQNMVTTRSMTRSEKPRTLSSYKFPSILLSDILFRTIAGHKVFSTRRVTLDQGTYDNLSVFNIVLWDSGFPSSFKVSPAAFPKLYKRRIWTPHFDPLPRFCRTSYDEDGDLLDVHISEDMCTMTLGPGIRDRINTICMAKSNYIQTNTDIPSSYPTWREYLYHYTIDQER